MHPFSEVEKKWQNFWEKNAVFRTPQDTRRPKYYVLDMFPYPSGSGLHVGHPEGYTATDIAARYKRMCGFNVLHPMGWDAFGLPAERYAMKTGVHPAVITKKNIDNFRRQLKSLGFSYDWEKEINTTEPSYYRWTQWIFLEMFHSFYDEKAKKARPITELTIPEAVRQDPKACRAYTDSKRLAFLSETPVNWCSEIQTVLANEEVEEWESKGYTVERRPMLQWMLRITAYAERLLEDIQHLDWPAGTLELQKNWIGRSQGAEISFPILGTKEALQVFTTRPDTIYGVTYMVIAPEHHLVNILTLPEQKKEVEAYIKSAARQSERERVIAGEKGKKTGVFTGGFVLHPFTKEKIPVWIADYVLKSYGTGAVMAVPAHDERDLAFASAFGLPVKQVITEDGFNIESDFLNGLPTQEAVPKCIQELGKRKVGKAKIMYKLRDWLFSRQRYWGEAIPISHDEEGAYYPLEKNDLPLHLPPMGKCKPAPDGTSPLGSAKDWLYHTGPSGEKLRREINTMPQWAGSCWYYLRFIDPENSGALAEPEKESYWMGKNGVDLYIGGAEHAVLHLLYARFWHKFLYDRGYVTQPEPFHKLVHQGLILGEDGNKMSKSLGNVVNPDSIIKEYGADAFRLFEMFLGPLEKSKPWRTSGIGGVSRFLARVWRLFVQIDSKENSKADSKTRKIDPLLLEEGPIEMRQKREHLLHSTIKKVSEDLEKLSFNTAIACLMSFVNEVYQEKQIGKKGASSFVLLLSPFAPHIAEELWEFLGNSSSLAYTPWPVYDAKKITTSEVEVVFQINGKVRAKALVKADMEQKELEKTALQNKNIQDFLNKNNMKANRSIIVKNKLVNLVCKH